MAATAAFMSPDPRPYSSPSSITAEKGSRCHADRSPGGFVSRCPDSIRRGAHLRARDQCDQVGPVRAATDDLDVDDARAPAVWLEQPPQQLVRHRVGWGWESRSVGRRSRRGRFADLQATTAWTVPHYQASPRSSWSRGCETDTGGAGAHRRYRPPQVRFTLVVQQERHRSWLHHFSVVRGGMLWARPFGSLPAAFELRGTRIGQRPNRPVLLQKQPVQGRAD